MLHCYCCVAETSFYDPSRPFTCLDGSKTIDFSEVNDDYCDCPDATDEPGELTFNVCARPARAHHMLDVLTLWLLFSSLFHRNCSLL